MSRVYIVEDHAVMRESYAALFDILPDLEVAGMSETAEEALERIPTSACDLVIVDISLPGMSGLELVRRLHDSSPELRLVVVTGHREARYGEEAAAAGAHGFVVKGETGRLLQAIYDALGG